MSLLGLDVGTTGCKAAAVSADGAMLATAYREYPTLHPRPGWAELASPQVYAKVKEVIAEVASQTSRDPVTALSVSSLGEAMTPVTADRQILSNCILGSDMRGKDYVDDLKRVRDQESFYEINPNILGPNYALPSLLWLRDNRRELYDRADRFLLWADLICFMLGGDPVASFSLANRTLLFDIRKEDWSDDLLGSTGIDRGKLGVTTPSGTIAGTVSPALAQELSLPEGVKIVVGGHDQCCNSLGAGICQAGRAVCGIGSFECITPTYDRIPDSAAMLGAGLNIEHHVLPGLYVSFIYNQAGTLVKWFRDTFASADRKLIGEGQDIYDVLAAEMPNEPTRLLTLPYFETTGPPQFVSDACGAIVGLKPGTTRGHILKSIMESCTFYFVESIDTLRNMGIDTSEFVATGGGAKSDAWLQIKADIFGIPFVRPRVTEGGILGAVILAGVATGVFSTAAEGVACCVARDRVFEPDPSRHDAYRERYANYKQLFGALYDLSKRL